MDKYIMLLIINGRGQVNFILVNALRPSAMGCDDEFLSNFGIQWIQTVTLIFSKVPKKSFVKRRKKEN